MHADNFEMVSILPESVKGRDAEMLYTVVAAIDKSWQRSVLCAST